jgi:hypothetical protein
MQEKNARKEKIFGGELSFRTVERGQGDGANRGDSLQASATAVHLDFTNKSFPVR